MSTTVSHSKIKTWRRCRKAFHYKYIEKLRPRRKGRPLVFGSICHEMIEAYANGDNPRDILKKYEEGAKKLFSAEVEEYMQIIADADLLMQGYFDYYKKDKLKFVAIKGKLAEHEFEVELTSGITLKGKIDAICRTTDKRVWLGEHKTHKRIPDEEARFKDLQVVVYASILPQLGIKHIDGILWDYIRSSPPSVPKLLKSGELSKAQIDTTPAVYLDTIREHKLNPKDYAEKLKELENNERSFYQRVYMPINSTLSKQLLEETIETAKEIAERGGKDKTRNITRDCSWCEYKGLCRAELTGMDADFIRKREFEEGEAREETDQQD